MTTETKAKEHGYTVKGVRLFKGMEGMGGFNATLYRDGKKVAELVNDDSGGETMFHFFDQAHGESSEENILKELCKTLPLIKTEYIPEGFQPDMDTFVQGLVGDWEENRLWKRKCGKGVLWMLHSDKPNTYREVKAPPKDHARVIKMVRNRFGDDVKEIINERFP